MNALLELITKRKSLRHPNLLTVRNYFFKHEKGSAFSCGNESKSEMFLEYPYLKRSLEDVI